MNYSYNCKMELWNKQCYGVFHIIYSWLQLLFRAITVSPINMGNIPNSLQHPIKPGAGPSNHL